jgi:hypothetical protein
VCLRDRAIDAGRRGVRARSRWVRQPAEYEWWHSVPTAVVPASEAWLKSLRGAVVAVVAACSEVLGTNPAWVASSPGQHSFLHNARIFKVEAKLRAESPLDVRNPLPQVLEQAASPVPCCT